MKHRHVSDADAVDASFAAAPAGSPSNMVEPLHWSVAEDFQTVSKYAVLTEHHLSVAGQQAMAQMTTLKQAVQQATANTITATKAKSDSPPVSDLILQILTYGTC